MGTLEGWTAGSTIAAAVLALLAIVLSGVQSKRSAEALRRERRIDFELGLLVEILDALEKGQNVAWRNDTMRTRLRVLGPVGLDVCRARFLLPSTPNAERLLRDARGTDRSTPAEDLRAVVRRDGADVELRIIEIMRNELDDAIRRRVAERG